METQLASGTELKLQRALKRFRDWRGLPADSEVPEPVRVLGDSSNNLSVLVGAERQYVVRINRQVPASNALDARAEIAALEHAAAAGLAPALRWSDPELGILVCDYLPPDPPAPRGTEELARLLRAIHQLPSIAARLSLTERIGHYECCLRERTGDRSWGRIEAFSQNARHCAHELEAADPHPVLCHNDLLPPNLICSKGRLWALDWEYAAMGSRWFDLAVVCAGERLDVPASTALAGRYLGRPPTSGETRLLHYARFGYVYLELLWYLVNARGYDPEPALARLHNLESDDAQV